MTIHAPVALAGSDLGLAGWLFPGGLAGSAPAGWGSHGAPGPAALLPMPRRLTGRPGRAVGAA